MPGIFDIFAFVSFDFEVHVIQHFKTGTEQSCVGQFFLFYCHVCFVLDAFNR